MSQLPLRERKKLEAMRRIQESALKLFSQRSFSAVTIEQVAAAANVSASTVYRYFGTKEGILLRDVYDDRILTNVKEGLAESDRSILKVVRAAIDEVADDHFVRDRQTTLARMKLWTEVDAVKAAGQLVIAQHVETAAALLADSGRCNLAEGRILAAAILNGLLASVVNWYEDGAEHPWADYGHRALDLLENRLTTM